MNLPIEICSIIDEYFGHKNIKIDPYKCSLFRVLRKPLSRDDTERLGSLFYTYETFSQKLEINRRVSFRVISGFYSPEMQYFIDDVRISIDESQKTFFLTNSVSAHQFQVYLGDILIKLEEGKTSCSVTRI